MRRLLSFCLAGLLLSVGLPVSTAPSAPSAAQAVEYGKTAAARAQTLLLSKGIAGENTDAAVAVDPNTGNVLVVWTQIGVPGDTGIPDDVIWASLLRRKGSGKYKKPRTRRLASDGGSQFGPDVGWIEASKEFFVIWEQNADAARGGFKRILGVPVNPRTGRAVGKVKTLVADDDDHASPVFVTAINNGSAGSRVAGSSVGQIVWRKEPPSPDDPTMEQASLSDTYEISNRATLPDSQIGFGPILGALALSGATVRTPASGEGGGGLVRCDITMLWKGSPPVTKIILTLRRDDEEVDSLTLEGYGSAAEIRHARSRTAGESAVALVTSQRLGTAYNFYKVKTPPCQKIEIGFSRGPYPGGSFEGPVNGFLGPKQTLALQLRQSPHREGSLTGHLVTTEDDGLVYRRAVDDQWNVLDGPEALFSHGNKLTSLIAHDVSSAKSRGKKPNALIVWTKSVGKKSDQEIWAYSFYVEPFE